MFVHVVVKCEEQWCVPVSGQRVMHYFVRRIA